MKLLEDSVKVAKAAIRSLKGNSDTIACQLYREGVRGAKCGNAWHCAIAQYVANKMPKGVTASVDGFGTVTLHHSTGDAEQSVSFATKQAVTTFIDEFDGERYPFLMTGRTTKGSK